MKIILLSGGSGKRLWPLSNGIRTKQFLKVLPSYDFGTESMIQRVYRQLVEVYPDTQIIVTASSTQAEQITYQLGENIDLVIEPENRDTFPAILLSCMYLHLEKKTNENEPILVMPVDLCTTSDFYIRLKDMENLVLEKVSDLVLMGIAPTCPSSQYGYIIPKTVSTNEGYCYVEKFKEKPCETEAKTLIHQGAMWNSGVFAFQLQFMLSFANSYIGMKQEYENILSQYQILPKRSFDYEVVEKTKSTCMIPFNGTWEDIGTWNTLVDTMGAPTHGDVILTDDNENTHVINELNIPLLVAGTSGMVVVASPDGILVSTKKASTNIKQYVDAIDLRPMYEEKRWGYYCVLDYFDNFNNMKVLTKKMVIESGLSISYQSHRLRNEIWIIVDGFGETIVEGIRQPVDHGKIINIQKGEKHSIRAAQKLTIIEIQMGSELLESDIEKWGLAW